VVAEAVRGESAVRREHPGQLIRRNILDRHGLSIADTARLLGVPTRTLLDLLTGKATLWPKLAERIEAVFGGRDGADRRRSSDG
jgi:plasmid maintenance system antidote protein VapI